jgi:hypothetical protein
MAIVLPLLVLLLFGTVEFGRFIVVHHSATTAGREATRFGIATGLTANGVPHYVDCDEIRSAAKSLAFGASLTDGQITVGFDHGPGTAIHTNCPVGSTIDPAAVVTGDRIVVTVATTFHSGVPLVAHFIDNASITVTDRRTIVKEVSG